MTPSEEQVRTAVAQQAGTWFIANQSGSLEQAERAAFVAWLKASPIHVEEYLGVALVAHDLPAAAEDPQLPLESLLELARADDTDGVVPLEASLPVREPAPKRMRAPRSWSFATSIAAVCSCWPHRCCGGCTTVNSSGCRRPTRRRMANRSWHSSPTARSFISTRIQPLRFGTPAASGWSRLREVRRSSRLRETITGAFGSRLAMHMYSLWEPSLISTVRPDATIVTVVEGSVAVLAGRPPPPGATGFPPGALRVNAGYQVHVDTGGVSAQPIPVDVQQTVAWLQRKIAFEQRPLGEVADEFNRYGSIPIEIDDAALRALPISGVFDAYDIDSFVAFLQTLDGVRVERTNARIRVFSVKSQKE